MRDDYDEMDMELREAADFPPVVRIAGVVWIVFGCVILLNFALALVVNLAQPDARDAGTSGTGAEAAGHASGNACASCLAFCFGAAFIHVGQQTVRGIAKDTLGNGVGSIIFGLLNLVYGVALLAAGAATGGSAAVVGLIAGSIGLVSGLALLAAGVLALIGRADYRAWRKAQKARQKERRERG